MGGEGGRAGAKKMIWIIFWLSVIGKCKRIFTFIIFYPLLRKNNWTVYNGGISSGWKWWQTVLENKNFMQQMRRVFGVFPSCSQIVSQVPNMFPKTFQIVRTSFFLHSILFGHGSSAMYIILYIMTEGHKWEAYLGFYVGKCPHVPKILVMGQSNGSLFLSFL